jgi:putative ABC transport system permease protein
VTRAIVSAALAHDLPVGTRFVSRVHGEAVVVGVVEDARSHLFGPRAQTVFYARVEPASPRMVILLHTPDQADAVRAALRDRLQRPGQYMAVLPALDHMPHMDSPVGRVFGVLATIVGSIVLVVLMGSVGLTYFLVASRTREIGLRRAMGATRRDVIRYFVLENMILTAAGGLITIAIMAIVLPSVLYEFEGYSVDKLLVAITVAAVVGLNLLATLIPARKAAAIPPVMASRAT